MFDIDGTLLSRGEAIEGAAAAVAHVRALGMQVRFLTNTTARTPERIAADLSAAGIAVAAAEVQTATTVCVAMLRARAGVRCHLMVPSQVLPMFDGIVRDDKHPQVVVISDIGEGFDFHSLNRAFLMLREGAELIALQKNLYWFDSDGPKLDCGAFVLGLEAAAGTRATVTGKPSKVFFESALAGLDCAREQVLVVGDDISTDVAGASAVGIRTVLVGTGKYADGQTTHPEYQASYFIDSVKDLQQLLGTL
ncbi:TIGR01458 family HAD-type hydrolase [Pseudoduganella sp. LjRoot289]|uniref:TIGR01458 family HAD-type hydrolase n=1 Tax=Pseudoduganella sp. LjRoot289 TaxID=3342314 RepID=UPI003ECE1E1B